jgi:hypothetical protein
MTRRNARFTRILSVSPAKNRRIFSCKNQKIAISALNFLKTPRKKMSSSNQSKKSMKTRKAQYRALRASELPIHHKKF